MNLPFDPEIAKKIEKWLHGNYDADTKAQIQQLIDHQQYHELTDAFYKDLEFGTGGLRGVMGPGPNRMNKYTVGAATQGLCNYLNKRFTTEKIKVAIAYDSRIHSKDFAKVTADVFSANGIHVYFFKDLRPTPELSFAIRYLGCQSGVVITASHNPKAYNGYKAYDKHGGQYVSPHDREVMEEVKQIKTLEAINFYAKEENIEWIGEEIDQIYLKKIASLSLAKEAINRQKNLSIVYSPIHGTGITLVPKALQQLGFTEVTIVKEQAEPNGSFPTVIYPNPEEKEALSLALQKAEAINADLVLATDPDADRVAMAIKNDENDFILMSGNQTGSLLIHYLLQVWAEQKKLTDKAYVVKTIVTTNLIEAIASSKGIACYNTLTGFKYIGELITKLEGEKTFIAGGEESYGYLVGELVRDKDAIVSSAFMAEMAAYFKDQGRNLFDVLLDIYLQHGMYKEKLISITKEGKSGAEEIISMMEKFREAPPQSLSGSAVNILKDYALGYEKNLTTGVQERLCLPKSNVLQFITADGSVISARPSGTEPKIKFYISVNTALQDKSRYRETEAALDEKIQYILKDLGL